MEAASLVISALALLVSGYVAWWIQTKMDNREQTKWRRDTLTNAAVDFVILSAKHENLVLRYLYEDDDDLKHSIFFDLTEVMDALHASIVTMKICNSQSVLPCAIARFDHNKHYFVKLPSGFIDDATRDEYFRLALDKPPTIDNIDELLRQDLKTKYIA